MLEPFDYSLFFVKLLTFWKTQNCLIGLKFGSNYKFTKTENFQVEQNDKRLEAVKSQKLFLFGAF